MGAGIHGGFGSTAGSLKDSNIHVGTVDGNVKRMKDEYPVTSSGYFGKKGKNVRIIETSNPENTSKDFYSKLGFGGKTEPLKNGKGTRTVLDDGTVIVHRLVTSTEGSPAVNIKVIKSNLVKSQKIHFVKEDK